MDFKERISKLQLVDCLRCPYNQQEECYGQDEGLVFCPGEVDLIMNAIWDNPSEVASEIGLRLDGG